MKDGGPAFPAQHFDLADGEHGMTLRDYFAAKAIAGLMVRNWSHHTGTDEELIAIWARSAYGVADAMIQERSKT
jgi:hypothetical protein